MCCFCHCFPSVLCIVFYNLQWPVDKHSCTESSSVCLKHWALGSVFHCPHQVSRWDTKDINQRKEVGTYRLWLRAPQSVYKVDDVNSQVWSHSWEGLGRWGVKGVQQKAGLSAIHIISALIPLHIDSAEYECLRHLCFCSKNSQESLQCPVTLC